MKPEPTPEHRWLSRLLGDWTWASEPVAGHEDHPPMTGTETVRGIGEIWVQGAGQGAYGVTLITLGFDTRTGRFVGTWIGTMMTHQWVYDGERSGDLLSLYATGPSFSGDGTLSLYRDEIELLSDDERLLRAFVQGADGSWSHFMTTRYRRA